MTIKITAKLPVADEVKPEIGSIHEAQPDKTPDGKDIFFISMGGDHKAQIGVFPNECEVVEP